MSDKRYCLIGAGACGIAIVKNFKERGIPFDCFEREADVGGIWNPESPHFVYETTRLNTSKRLTRYTDFPIPGDYPQFLNRQQATDYIRAYARHFELYDAITFNTEVEKVEKDGDTWLVTISGETRPRTYDGVVIANGHHWDPKFPDYPGNFDGEILHSHELKTMDAMAGKRVLVVGGGNSGCDIAADAAIAASKAYHSMRRTYFFLPKFALGRPLDVIIDLTQRWPVPRRFLRWLYKQALFFFVGPHSNYGLPDPDHKLLEAHPAIAPSYLHYLLHGEIKPKPDIERLDGKRVVFKDGSADEVDLIVYATGFHLTFPFIEKSYFLNADSSTNLFLNLFHRELDNLFVIGLLQPADGSFWQLADYQGQIIAAYLLAQETSPEKAAWFRKTKATAKPSVDHGVTYVDSERHKLEVQHYRYRTYIKKLLKKFGPVAKASWPSKARDAERPASVAADLQAAE